MTVAYCDTSTLVDVIEGNSLGFEALTKLDALRQDGAALVSSAVTIIEIERYLSRPESSGGQRLQRAQDITAILDLIDITNHVVGSAASLPVVHLAALDAIHVASALLVQADLVLTRDRQMIRACEELGLTVAS